MRNTRTPLPRSDKIIEWSAPLGGQDAATPGFRSYIQVPLEDQFRDDDSQPREHVVMAEDLAPEVWCERCGFATFTQNPLIKECACPPRTTSPR